MDVFLQLTISGLANGMVYALAAVGFVVIYKASDVINFAQGELLLFGAYLAFDGSRRIYNQEKTLIEAGMAAGPQALLDEFFARERQRA